MKKTNLNLARELATAYAANLPHDALREQLEALGCPRLAIDAAFADNLAPSAVEAMDERQLDAAIETAAREIVDALERHAAAAALGRKGGRSRSAAKVAAVRANGAKGGRPAWRVVDRWDVDADGAEDLLVRDQTTGRRLLLARRHNLGAADPATWCAAFECGAAVDVRETAARVGEHILSLAEAFDVQEWPAEQVARVADLALARQVDERNRAADAEGRPQTFVHGDEAVVAWGEELAKRLDAQTIVRRTLKAFAAVGWTVSAEAVSHNLAAWRSDFKSGFRDEVAGVHLFTPCGCNPFRVTASRLRAEWADWQTTYTA